MTAIPPAGRDAPTCDVCLNPLPDDEAILDFGRHPECDRFVLDRAEAELAASFPAAAAAPRPAGPTPEAAPRDVLSVEQIAGVRALTAALRQPASQDVREIVLTLLDSHESLRIALASARAALDAMLIRVTQAEAVDRESYEKIAHLTAALSKAERERDNYRGGHEKAEEALVELQAALSEVTRREEALLRFAGRALNEARIEQIGDWDGGDLEETMVECGLLAPHEATEPCDPESCRCTEFGFPTTCYRFTELGKLAAARAALPEETK